MTSAEAVEVVEPDGRTLEVLLFGDPSGVPLLYHSGSPSGAVPDPGIDRAARATGLRVVTYSRPGYGASTPRPAPAYVADDVQDSSVILQHLGISDFVTLGWSGGGPRALGCAALLSLHCRAAATLAGVAPVDADGLDWLAGMGAENVEDFEAAQLAPDAYLAYLEQTMPPMLTASPDQIVAAFGQLMTPVDAAYVTGEFAESLAESLHRAGAQGVIGVRDDGLALTTPWGFDVSGIHVPVAVWKGRQDAMVPFGHGEWLAANIPGARPHLFEDEGHLSLAARMEEILLDLRRIGGL